ncbi:hypothetical protein CUMW_276380 [Citrus unshiu]|nr:hypothetical protein CUMW_276380 [Citrus unshiu]
MLLWMGGSRRKVTTSRKSAQKRKRQQQQTAVLDSHADPKEHRSLDVLSLLNLSTTAEERKCACLNGTEDASTVKYPITKDPAKIFTNTETFADSVDYKEVGADVSVPHSFKFSASDSQNNACNESSCNSHLRKTTNIQRCHDARIRISPVSGGCLEFSSGTINSRSHRKQKYSTVHDCEPFDGCGSKLQNSFGDSEFFHGIMGPGHKLEYRARSSFVDDNLHIENRLNASGRNWQSQKLWK